jgi:DNA-binding response OmpR family regulator
MILVVEDYPDLRTAIVSILGRKHYVCEGVGSAGDAIEHLRLNQYEAILLSPTAPVASDPVMHFLVENQPEQLRKVILMTEPDVTADEFPVLFKPFNGEQLFSKLPSNA